MKNSRSHFKFNKQERSGIFFLLLLIGILQGAYYLYSSNISNTHSANLQIDAATSRYIDSVQQIQSQKKEPFLSLFNPNFISDYKGYLLGMSIMEIDRLHAFRNQNKFVRSAKEFQEITRVSDSLLTILAPYFKFPNFKKTKKENNRVLKDESSFIDLNVATEQELKRISGIGDILARRIINFRNSLGGFMTAEQLYDVYGLEEDVVGRALNYFKVIKKPLIKKININTASAEQISQLTYIKIDLANRIVTYRDRYGSFLSYTELTKIEDFPADKIDRIRLYLAL
jgi:competence ComEA-like helix-hairpin-helix protein